MITTSPRSGTRRAVSTALPRAVGRLLTGSTYAVLGFDALRAPGARVGQAAGTLATLRKAMPLPTDDEVVVRTNGAAQMIAGGALALGVAPRGSAAVLIGSLVPTTVAGHGFWRIDDPATRKLQCVQFHKNLAMLGGLCLVLGDATRTRRGRRRNG
jgi:uncharacterized membrane protein YphA (DoxX/SURF4 family)